ncbi:MAG: hypothetical protein GY839_16940 [candidate division Zixibacteria bacterium]|nr:hypothetical protein [candidate division Zixibacteria bacterium]
MPKFVTCLNCMDGRVQLPVIGWIREKYDAEHVDMITEAGMDGFLVNRKDVPEELRKKINISLEIHGSSVIFIVGHHDCGGHPVDELTHKKHVLESADKIKKVYPGCAVYGLWVSGLWQIEKLGEL